MANYVYFQGTMQEVYEKSGYYERTEEQKTPKNIGKKEYNHMIQIDIIERGAILSDERFNKSDIMNRCTDTTHLDASEFYGYRQGDFEARTLSYLDRYSESYMQLTKGSPEEGFMCTYVDDSDVLCGFSIRCIQDNSNLSIPEADRPWIFSCAIIQNCNAHPDNRRAFYITHPNMLILSEPTKVIDQQTQIESYQFPIISHLNKTKPSGQCSKKNLFVEIVKHTNSKRLNALIHKISTNKKPHEVLQNLNKRFVDHDFDEQSVRRLKLNEILDKMRLAYPKDAELEKYLQVLNQESIDNVEFFEKEGFLKILQHLDNIDCFKQTLDAFPKNTHDEKRFHQTGVALLNNITHIIGSDPSTLTTKDLSILNEVVETATNALTNPNDAKTIKKLGKLTQTVSGKSSRFWKGLGASLLAFTGAALVVAGVLGAIPTGGVSLILVAAGAAALTVAGGASVVKGREHGFAKSISLFKTNLPKGTNLPPKDQPASKDEDLKDDDKSKGNFGF